MLLVQYNITIHTYKYTTYYCSPCHCEDYLNPKTNILSQLLLYTQRSNIYLLLGFHLGLYKRW